MGMIPAIALHVFRDSVRDRVFYNLLGFAVLLVGASLLLGQMTAGQELKIIKDLGLAATSIFGLFIAVFIGIGLVSKEVERRSIYSVLAKPVTRPVFIAGKFAGLALTLAVNLVVMTIALYAVLAWFQVTTPMELRPGWETPPLDPAMMKAVLLIGAELLVVTAMALFFSTFTSPILAAAFTFGLYLVGQFNADLRNFEAVVESKPVVYLARALYFTLPNLAPFDVKAQVVHGQPVPWGYIGLTLLYAAAYITLLLVAAVLVFSRRDLK